METRKQTHPTPRQLAAFALGKLTPESRGRMQEHLTGCATCSTFLSQTPRDTLVTLLRQAAAGIPASEQSTPGVRDASTFSGLPASGAAPSVAARQPEPLRPKAQAPSTSDNSSEKPSDADIPQALREQTKYRVIRLLGRGGMGSVYEAYHERMDRRVAIKVINPSLVDHPDALKRFDQEVRSAARLHHPNVAMAYDADEFGTLRALVMEFVPGQSLDRYLAKQGALSVRQACDFIQQAAAGLNNAFKQGMVHRDLKPQNMMLTPDGKIKILDFGLAKLASERRKGDGLTRENALMGTAAYLAPEQALDAAKADVRADIYALGCTLYCLLAGTPPFGGDTEMKVLLAHQHDTPRPLVEVRPDVPQGLSDLVDRMLAKNPADRPQTPAEVAKVLVPFVKGTGTTRAPPPAPTPPQSSDVAMVEVPLTDDLPTRRGSRITTATRPRRPAAQSWAQILARIPPAWRRPGLVGLLLFSCFFGVWGISVLVRTPTGTIIVENVPTDAEVLLDNGMVTLIRDRDEVTIEAVQRGNHRIKIKQGGHEVWSDDVELKLADEQVRARFEPNGAMRLGRAGATKNGPEAATSSRPTVEIPAGAKRVDLLPLVHPPEDGFQGAWVRRGNVLASTDPKWNFTRIQYAPPSEYDVRMVFVRPTFPEGVGIHCSHAGRHLGCIVGAYGNRICGIGDIDGKRANGNPSTTIRENCLTTGQRHELVCQVRNSGTTMFLDGLICSQFHGGYERFAMAEADPDPMLFWSYGPTNFEVADLFEITGEGKLLREQDTRSAAAPAKSDAALPIAMQKFPNADAVTGNWKMEGDELVQSSLAQENTGIAFGDPAWSQYNITLRGRSDAGMDGFRVAWHVQDVGNDLQCRVLRLGVLRNSRHDIVSFIKGKPLDNEAQIRAGTVDRGRWYDVRIEVRGTRCECFLDGRPLFSAQDAKLSSGRVGLGCFATAFRFKDIVITSEDGKTILWHGSPKLPAESNADGFLPLFNGRDLAGWQTHQAQPDGWTVQEGVLVGNGPDISYLYTKRDDFEDAEVRAEVKINAGGNSGIVVRTPYGPVSPEAAPILTTGYEANIGHAGPRAGTGAVFAGNNLAVPVDDAPVSPDQWFTFKETVRGNEVTVMVNDTEVAHFVDEKRLHKSGRIAIQLRGAGTKVEFRKIEVRRLSASQPGTAARPADAKEFAGSFYKVFPEQMSWHQARDRCIALGGHLAVVNDYAHNKFLTELTRAAAKEDVWLGATDEANEGQWVWVDGRKMVYTNWDTAVLQPNNKDGAEHYLMLRDAGVFGRWFDQPDFSTEAQPGFVCQWD